MEYEVLEAGNVHEMTKLLNQFAKDNWELVGEVRLGLTTMLLATMQRPRAKVEENKPW